MNSRAGPPYPTPSTTVNAKGRGKTLSSHPPTCWERRNTLWFSSFLRRRQPVSLSISWKTTAISDNLSTGQGLAGNRKYPPPPRAGQGDQPAQPNTSWAASLLRGQRLKLSFPKAIWIPCTPLQRPQAIPCRLKQQYPQDLQCSPATYHTIRAVSSGASNSLATSDGDRETKPQPDLRRGHAGHASRQSLFPALLLHQYGSRPPTSAILPTSIFHCMLLIMCLLACYWLQRKKYENAVFIYHAIHLMAAFFRVSSGLDRASQTIFKGLVFSNHKYLTLLTLFYHSSTIGVAKYACRVCKGIQENGHFFLGHLEGYLLICLFMYRHNLKANTSSENMTACPPCSQAVKLCTASPRSTAAFNGETDVLLSDMAFVPAFDSDPRGNAETFSIQIFKTVLSAL